jgi:hypothetical protein
MREVEPVERSDDENQAGKSNEHEDTERHRGFEGNAPVARDSISLTEHAIVASLNHC